MPVIRSAPASRQTKNPQINRGNRLGAKVIEHISLNGSIRALVAGTYGTLGASGAIKASQKGIGLRGSGASARGSIALDLSAKSKITLAFWLYWDAYANDDALAMEFGSTYTAENGILIDPNASGVGGNFLVGVGNPGGSNLVTFARPTAGAWHRIALALDRTTGATPSTAVWLDGVRQTIATPLTVTPTSGNFANTTLNLMSRAGASLFGTGNLQDITIYDGLLNDGEAAADYRNPYQIFRDGQPRLLFDVPAAGGGTSYSYTASGGMVLSGAIGAVRGRVQAASGGIQTGGAAGVARGAQRSTSGGMTFAGAATRAVGKAVTAAGGLVFGGAASSVRGVARAAAGGIVFAGQAGVTFFSAVQSRVVNPVGGIVIAGSALVARSVRKAAAGGLSFAGRAATTFFPPGVVTLLNGMLPEFVRRRRRK